MRFLLPFILCIGGLLGAADATALALPPPAAQRAIETYDAAVAKAKAAYDAALRTASTDLSKALTAVQADETRKGNLDGALAVRALLTAAAEKNGVPADVLKPAEPKPVTPPAKQETMFGTWKVTGTKHNGTAVLIREDGTALWNGRMAGRWTGDKGALVIKWANGFSYIITNTNGKLSYKEFNPGNITVGEGGLDKWE